MKEIRYPKPSLKARAWAGAAAFVASAAVISAVLSIFMSATGETVASLAGIRPAPAAASAAVVESAQRLARRG